MSVFRLTGKAEAVRERSGVSNRGTAEERAWVIRTQGIRVNDFVVTDLQLNDDEQPLQIGTQVDLIVDVTARGGYLTAVQRGNWPAAPINSLPPLTTAGAVKP